MCTANKKQKSFVIIRKKTLPLQRKTQKPPLKRPSHNIWSGARVAEEARLESV